MDAVGIGCFWFARRYKEDEHEVGIQENQDHLSDIKEALEGVDNISNVEIYGDHFRTYGGGPLEGKDEYNTFPIYTEVLIEFDIFVPRRLQEKYALGRTADNAESFHVIILYKDIMPVCYVYYDLDGKKDQCRNYSPSTAIVFIRKYLDERLRDHDVIDFQMVGPSPLWCDSFLSEVEEKSTEKSFDLSDAKDGYRTLYFDICGKSARERVLYVAMQNNETIANFYYIVRMRNYARNLRQQLVVGTTELLETERREPIWGVLSSFKQRKNIDRILSLFLENRLDQITRNEYLAEVDDGARVDKESKYYYFIEKEKRANEIIPQEDIREILLMIEDRRRNIMQNGVAIISAVIGGLVGAVIGALVGVKI